MSFNWYLVASGFLAAFCSVGHLAMGGKMFLKPMMEASFNEVPKKAMHCVFHFITVDFVLATIVLLAAGFRLTFGHGPSLLVVFIAVHFALYGIVQILMVLSSGIREGLSKIFQWSIFLLVATFAFLGVI
jgi:hypothetical protein